LISNDFNLITAHLIVKWCYELNETKQRVEPFRMIQTNPYNMRT